MDSIAAEATNWMQQNAKWKSRIPGTYRSTPKGTKGYEKSAYNRTYHAKAGLEAIVTTTKEEDAAAEAYQAGLGAAKRADELLIQRANRRASAKRIAANEKAMRTGKYVEGMGSSRTQSEFNSQQIERVPDRYSNVNKYIAENKPKILPIGTLKFRHDPHLNYAVWLEVAMGGRFSILGPAIAYWYPKTQARIKQILNLRQFHNNPDYFLSSMALESEERIRRPEGVYAGQVADYEAVEGKPYVPFKSAKRQRQRTANKKTYRKHGRVQYFDQ